MVLFKLILVDMLSYHQCCLLFFLFICFGCESHYLTVKRSYVDRAQLASTFVGSPDPRQANPPTGEKLDIIWHLSSESMKDRAELFLHLVYKDYSQKTLVYPIHRRYGRVSYTLLDKIYREKKGFLTYKVNIINSNGDVLGEWKQVLWTDLIELEGPDFDKD